MGHLLPSPCTLDKNDINYFVWGTSYWINGDIFFYKIYPNKK
tara:strand:- start:1372 stop:1497 length:126 start_codon:yes stop_codon:yes gene_type:complete